MDSRFRGNDGSGGTRDGEKSNDFKAVPVVAFQPITD